MPLTLVTTSLFSTSVSLFLFCYIHSFNFKVSHIRVNKWYLSLSDLPPVYTPTNSVLGFPFLHIFANILFVFSLMRAILIHVTWYLIVVLIAFPWWLVVLSIFSYACWHMYVFFRKKCQFKYSAHLLIRLFGFFWYRDVLALHILWILSTLYL